MQNIEVIYKDINEIKPYDKNPRKNDKAVDKVALSIQEYGFKNPIIVDKDMVIIAGHTRYKAAKKLGLNEVPIIVAGDLDENQVKALRIADNKTGEYADWDFILLAEELGILKENDFNLEFTGFEIADIEKLLNQNKEIVEDDFDVDANIPEVPISKRGDVWLLGRHRLVCGDSTMIDDVEKLMDGQKANLVVTDPPYNVDYEGGTKDKLKIQNDNMDNDSFYQFLLDMYKNLYLACDDGAGIYVFHADTEGINFRKAMIDAGWKLAQCCIWVKQSLVLGRQDYHWQHEPILYGWKPTGSHKWYADRKQSTVWRFDRPSKNEMHPTMKPVELVAYPIQNTSLSNSIVLDLFGGSGSTLIACEQTNRICYTMEIDEKYVDVIIKRYIQFKGNDADVFILRDGEKVSYEDMQEAL